MYLHGIIKEIKELDEIFSDNKHFGKVLVEISYQNGKYTCDNVTSHIVNKRNKHSRFN